MIKNQEETTLYKLLNAFVVYGDENFQINSTVIGPTEEMDVEKMDASLFPILFINPSTASIDKGEADISIELIIATLQPNDLKSRTYVLSNMFYVMKDIIALGHNHAYDDTKFIPRCTMELPVSLDPFTARFENMLVGWSTQLTFGVDNTNDVCLIPMS
ncbi:MAG: hypothetical protein Unbinned2250contig1000_16 [Prokaryotic dsDNA virus sp.]|nr:MAG: hypothetical protein Unbinned2250contig1000_16 [Prokaryotic dsDNA virus sp.]|tara:strand:- start:316 stop:792 length:477 start_codon:yes stop_codon:yes gene_type:complete